MPIAITQILTRAAESIGATKQARRPSPNRVNYWPADEMNRALDGLAAISQWLGLSDGSTPDTIFQALRAFSGPRASVFKTFEDFLVVDLAGAKIPYVPTVVGAGSTVTNIAALNEVGGGNGIVALSAANVASGSAMLSPIVDTLRGSQLPDLRVRFKTPASWTGADLRLGISNLAETTYGRIRATGSGLLSIETKSVTGGGTGSVATVTTLAVSTWYELRVKMTATSVDYYIDGALIAQESTGARIPVAADTMAIFLAKIDRTAAGPHVLNIDWFELAATRL